MNDKLIISKYKELVLKYTDTLCKQYFKSSIEATLNDFLIDFQSLQQQEKEPDADIDALIEKYIKEELPKSNSSFHWQAEGAASLRDFKEWIKRQNKAESVDQPDITAILTAFATDEKVRFDFATKAPERVVYEYIERTKSKQ